MSEWGSGPTQGPWGADSPPWDQRPARGAGDGPAGSGRKPGPSFFPERVSADAGDSGADEREGRLGTPQKIACVLLACYAGLPGILGAALALHGRGAGKQVAKWCAVGLAAGLALTVAVAVTRGETSAAFSLLGFNPGGLGGQA